MTSRLPFEDIWARAVERKGEAELNERLPEVLTAEDIIGFGDDRCLAAITQHVFSAGFRWSVIRAKWDGFEEAFLGFDPRTVAAFDDVRVEELRNDTRIVRNPQKIKATVANAQFAVEIAAEHGSFAHWIAEWPEDDVVGLWHALAKRGSRLGGATGPRSLRTIGKDTFILAPDVTKALEQQGVLTGSPTAKGQQKRAQEAFLAWKEESGRPLAEISMVLACSVD